MPSEGPLSTDAIWTREHALPDGQIIRVSVLPKDGFWETHVEQNESSASTVIESKTFEMACGRGDELVQSAHPHSCVKCRCADWHSLLNPENPKT
jgi:hypothetical protein